MAFLCHCYPYLLLPPLVDTFLALLSQLDDLLLWLLPFQLPEDPSVLYNIGMTESAQHDAVASIASRHALIWLKGPTMWPWHEWQG